MKSQSPDWQKARSLYDSNVAHAVIVKGAGVSLPALKKRIVREKWKVARREAREIIETQSIQQRGEQMRSRALNECDHDLEVVEQHPPKNLGQAERRQDLLTKVVDNADRLCGWSKGVNPSTVINIANLASARLADPKPIEEQGVGQAGVIDVKPEVDNGPTPESDAVSTADSRPTSIPCAESYAKNGKPFPHPAVIDVSAQPPQAPAGENAPNEVNQPPR